MGDDDALTEADREAAALIEVYFELEEPEERDALVDQLSALDCEVARRFLKTMMETDEDEIVRATAAAVLALRGDPDAIARLEADVSDPEDLYFFTHAVQALVELRGAAFYDTLKTIWRDPERDGDERREAMLGMETCDRARALADFLEFVAGLNDFEVMPDDELEVALLAFVRAEHKAALPALRALAERIAKSALAADERQELTSFVEEGIALLD